VKWICLLVFVLAKGSFLIYAWVDGDANGQVSIAETGYLSGVAQPAATWVCASFCSGCVLVGIGKDAQAECMQHVVIAAVAIK